jgi:hypothetical protein
MGVWALMINPFFGIHKGKEFLAFFPEIKYLDFRVSGLDIHSTVSAFLRQPEK